MFKISLFFVFLLINASCSANCDRNIKYSKDSEFNEAIMEWRKSGIANNLQSQLNQVSYCLVNLGIVNSHKEVINWLEKKSKEGNSQATLMSAVYYSGGVESGQIFIQKTVEWAKKGLEQNDPDAKYILSMIYLDGLLNHEDKDYGIDLLNDAAKENSISAQSTLAFGYQYGLYELDKNIEQSKYWKNKADITAKSNNWKDISESIKEWQGK